MSEKHSIGGGEGNIGGGEGNIAPDRGNGIAIIMRNGEPTSFAIVDPTGSRISEEVPLTPKSSSVWYTTPRLDLLDFLR